MRMNESVVSGKSTVSSMWENFSVDDYDLKQSTIATTSGQLDRSKSASMSRMHTKREKDARNEQSKWKHRITVPEPFKMTVREEKRGKSARIQKVWKDVEREREQVRQSEEAELEKQFRAQPVPAHVYMPLYDDLQQKSELRRMQNKTKSHEWLKSQEKPFKFSSREDEKRRAKAATLKQSVDAGEKKVFKAKPYPKKLFEGTAQAMQDEQDEYRKIRKEMRSQQLLTSSSLPPNMATREQQSQERLREKRSNYSMNNPNFQPRTNSGMPDFDVIHRNAMRESSQQKARRENTVCKPFNLRTTSIDTKHKVYQDIERDEVMLKETRWPFQSSRMRPASAPRLSHSSKYR